MRTVAALQPGLGFISVVGVVGVAVVLLGAFSSQAMVALAFFAALFLAALFLAAILIKISPRIVFLGLVLGYFFGGNIFGKLGLASAGIPLYMGEIGIGLGVTLLLVTDILEHREWRAAFVIMRPVLLPFGIFLVMGVASVVFGAFGVVRAEISAIPIAISAIPWIGDIYSGFYSAKVGVRHFAFVYYALMFVLPSLLIRSITEFQKVVYLIVGCLLLTIPNRGFEIRLHLSHYYYVLGMVACLVLLYRERSPLVRVGLCILGLWSFYLTAIDGVRSNWIALMGLASVLGLHWLRTNWRSVATKLPRRGWLIYVTVFATIGVLVWLLIPSSSFRELTSIFNQVDKFRILFSGNMADYRGGNEGWRTAMWGHAEGCVSGAVDWNWAGYSVLSSFFYAERLDLE